MGDPVSPGMTIVSWPRDSPRTVGKLIAKRFINDNLPMRQGRERGGIYIWRGFALGDCTLSDPTI
jgi:hypothetical protein